MRQPLDVPVQVGQIWCDRALDSEQYVRVCGQVSASVWLVESWPGLGSRYPLTEAALRENWQLARLATGDLVADPTVAESDE